MSAADLIGLYDRVADAAAAFLRVSPAKHAALMSPFKVAQHAEDRAAGRGRWGCHRFGAYILLWDLVTPWYSSEEVLIEDLLLKVYPEDATRTLQEVLIQDIPELARTLGVRYVFTGDTQGKFYMGQQYAKAGYSLLGTQHCMEV